MSNDAVIDIQVERIAQIFDSFDPYPFRERDLDRAAEEYITGFARELPRGSPIRIVVHLPPTEAQSHEAAHLPDAIRRFFAYRADGKRMELRELLRLGRRSLGIGLVVLALCSAIGELLLRAVPDGPGVLREGILILGWVANWRPLEIFLYDWWPLTRQQGLFRRLAAAAVEVRVASPAQPLSGGAGAP
ncbi:MAG: hypothetical protein U1E56_13160 [Bauldia sp.]